MDRFVATGVDPSANNALARALQHKARPLLGFVKSYRKRFPAIQRQVDIALHHFVAEGDEKGVALMMWLDANPMAEVPESAYVEENEDDCHEDDGDVGSRWVENALFTAMWKGRPEIVKCLRIDPTKVPPKY